MSILGKEKVLIFPPALGMSKDGDALMVSAGFTSCWLYWAAGVTQAEGGPYAAQIMVGAKIAGEIGTQAA